MTAGELHLICYVWHIANSLGDFGHLDFWLKTCQTRMKTLPSTQTSEPGVCRSPCLAQRDLPWYRELSLSSSPTEIGSSWQGDVHIPDTGRLGRNNCCQQQYREQACRENNYKLRNEVNRLHSSEWRLGGASVFATFLVTVLVTAALTCCSSSESYCDTHFAQPALLLLQ